jgi:hypothetical protein
MRVTKANGRRFFKLADRKEIEAEEGDRRRGQLEAIDAMRRRGLRS